LDGVNRRLGEFGRGKQILDETIDRGYHVIPRQVFAHCSPSSTWIVAPYMFV